MDFFCSKKTLVKIYASYTYFSIFFSGTPDVSSCCSLSYQNSMKCFDHFPEIGLSKSEFQILILGSMRASMTNHA